MTCIRHANTIMCMGKIDFKCPHCNKKYSDTNERYCNLLNKYPQVKIKCKKCGKRFYVNVTMYGNLVSYK